MWYLDSTRFFVQQFEVSDKQIIARLQPLAGGSVHHVFGYETPVLKVSGITVGATDRDAIRAMARTGTTHTLTFDGNTIIGAALVSSVTATKRNMVCQTLRPDLPEDSPLYDIELEMWVDE